ncbi:MAG: hypothetical protein EPN88_00365 [Bacteroidetes bacterium]|nr:MAG: hypothetical protein EPN88_00365 [Bacteroidota bacterium]
MVTESEKYKNVLNILRKSPPVLDNTEEIEREVIKNISKNPQTRLNLSDLSDFLFGWIYIGWVRRSLITASVILVTVFIYQQGIILKQINYLSRQTIVVGGEASILPSDDLEKKLMMYKLTGHRFSSKKITISEKQMEQLLESVNELQVKYKDLLNLIDEDPELKKYFEKKIIENDRTKIKL